MTAGEIAAVIASVVGTLLLVGFLVAFASLLRAQRRLLAAIEDLRREVVPLAGQWRETVDKANTQLARTDTILDTAESVGTTVDSFSRLAYLAFSNPLIKVMAIGTGTARAARALRRGR
jgi:HAMP domain-containing protein